MITRERLHGLLGQLCEQWVGRTSGLAFRVETVEAEDGDDHWLEADIDLTVPVGRKEAYRETLRDLTDALGYDAAWEFDPDEDVEEADDGWRLTVCVRLDRII